MFKFIAAKCSFKIKSILVWSMIQCTHTHTPALSPAELCSSSRPDRSPDRRAHDFARATSPAEGEGDRENERERE